MTQRRFYNPNLPQTLVIAQILLYINVFFEGIVLLQVGLSSFNYPPLGKILLATAVVTQAVGAYGIANEKKIGYQIAVFASFLPLLTRVISVIVTHGSIVRNLGFILLAGSPLNVLFEYALIALLLHKQSSEYQRVWFH